jgi:hypothetical protein
MAHHIGSQVLSVTVGKLAGNGMSADLRCVPNQSLER